VCLILGILSRFRLGKPFQEFRRLDDAGPLDSCEPAEVVQKLRLCVLNPRLYAFVHRTGGGAHPRYLVLKFVPDRRACATSFTLVYRTDAIRLSPIG
jgi:hypothetical protein